MRPVTRYAKSGDVHIAYQVTGAGPLDLVWVPGFVSHLEHDWEEPASARFTERLAAFSRLIRFDKRGTGLGPCGRPDARAADGRRPAVMDAVGSERAALFGISEGGPMSLLFAATYPERTTALVIYGSYARRSWAPDHPLGSRPQMGRDRRHHGRDGAAPGSRHLGTERGRRTLRQWWAAYLRLAASPGAAVAVMRMNGEIDVRHVLPAIRVPTLILHRTGDRLTSIEQARVMAQHIAGRDSSSSRGSTTSDGRGHRRHRRRDRRVPHGGPARPRARPRPGHGALHRHRRLHGEGRLAGRSSVA